MTIKKTLQAKKSKPKKPLTPLPAGGRVVGIIVGIETYQKGSGFDETPWAKNDANEFAQTIEKIYANQSPELMVLINEGATTSTIKFRLKQAIESLEDNDLFIFYYAGHGFHGSLGNRITGWDSNAAFIDETTLLVREILTDPLEKASCERALAFVDACAAEYHKLIGARSVLNEMSDEELQIALQGARYNALFLSCSPGQKSYPSPELKHGIWTYFLLRALNGEEESALDGNRLLTATTLQDYLNKAVKTYVTTSTTHQNPQTPRAMIASSGTFAICEVPEIRVKIGPEGDFSQVAPKIKRDYLQNVQTGAISHLPTFKKGVHVIYKNTNSSTNTFVKSLLAPVVTDDLEQIYKKAKDVFGYRRKELNLVHSDDGQGRLDADHFRYWVESQQDPDEATEYRIVRRLMLRSLEDDSIEKLDDIFGSQFDELIVEVEGFGMQLDDLVEIFEEIKEKHGGELDDRQDELFFSRGDGLTIHIAPSDRRMRLTWRSKQRPSQIFAQIKTIKFGLTGADSFLLS